VISALMALLDADGRRLLRAQVAGIVAFAVLQGVAFVLIVPIVDALLQGDDDRATRWLVVLTAVAAAASVAFYAQAMIAHRLGTVVARTLHRRLGDHVAALPLGWFGATRVGELTRLSGQGVTDVMTSAGHLLRPMVAALVTPATVVVAMYAVDWRLALATTLTAPLIYGAHRLSGWLARRAAVDVQATASDAGGRIVEAAQIQPVLRAYGQAGEHDARLDDALLAQHAARRRQLWTMSMGLVASALAVQLAFLVVMIVGVDLALGGSIDVPELVALLVLVARFGQPLVEAADIVGAIRVAQGSLRAIARVLDTPALPEPTDPRRPVDGSVRLEGVAFDYGRSATDGAGRSSGPAAGSGSSGVASAAKAGGGAPAGSAERTLEGIDVDVPAGTMLALVGPSGAGKTTVARLVARFWDVDEGTVRVGGVDVRDIATADLMAHIAVVFQDVYLFDTTIEENVRAGRPDATVDEVRAAARAARVDEIVDRLPDGWGTRVGEGGHALSGGERQRVSIARAILKDAPIVLLDEATSALDPENEAAVDAALAELARDRTVIVIAHRLSTVVGADRIVVLEAGRIAEHGRHADLLAAGGRYASFWRERTRAQGWRIERAGATGSD